MAVLIIVALIWLLLHLGVAGTFVRQAIIARIGANPFRALFSGAALVVLAALVRAYAYADTVVLWSAPGWLRWLLAGVMLPAFVLLVAAFRANPTAAGGEQFLRQDVRGIQRVTRHPMMVAVATWAAVHMIGAGDAASLVFFGTFLVTAAAGMPSIDRKVAGRNPGGWVRLNERTSILPFVAILAGRNHFSPGEIGWLVPAIGVVLWLAALLLHGSLFGVSPLPP